MDSTSNVVALRPASAPRAGMSDDQIVARIVEQQLASKRDPLDQARELLAAAPWDIRHREGETSPCDLVVVEKIKALLDLTCDDGGPQLEAMGLVELARLALVAGEKSFKASGRLTYTYAIADLMEAALRLLEAQPPDDPPPGDREAA